MSDAYRTPAAPLSAIVEEMLRGGIRDVVICPGSRSTPLALALRTTPALRCWVHLDERSGAFFALGAARAARRPAAILATSGTAVVNFAPAVTEARYGRVPLLLLTADRPPELQGVGAPQAIDQVELYGRHAKWFAELPVPDDDPEAEAEVRSVVTRALDVATSAPAGPVQLNLPFREPLLPVGSLLPALPELLPDDADGGPPPVAPEDIERVLPLVRAAARPLIVCGPLDRVGFAPAVAGLAGTLRAPLLADVLAGVRNGPHARTNVVVHHDALLRTPWFRERPQPDLVIRFGGRPVSKPLVEALDRVEANQLLIDDGGGWNVPAGPTITRLDADPVAFARALSQAASGEASGDPAWSADWLAADATAAAALQVWRDGLEEPFEGDIPGALDETLPDDAIVFVGNSMPVRDLDTFLSGSGRVGRLLGNRGASGIDGLLSTAFGMAAAQEQPVVAVVGDLALLHDLTALAAATRLGIHATVVLVDNDGGGIFSFLPQGAAETPALGLPQHFEELFGTPHGLNLGPVVSALGARHQRVAHDGLVPALREALDRSGVDVIELRTERARNVELHREAFAAVARALEEGT